MWQVFCFVLFLFSCTKSYSWYVGSVVAAHESLVVACGLSSCGAWAVTLQHVRSQFPAKGIERGSLADS